REGVRGVGSHARRRARGRRCRVRCARCDLRGRGHRDPRHDRSDRELPGDREPLPLRADPRERAATAPRAAVGRTGDAAVGAVPLEWDGPDPGGDVVAEPMTPPSLLPSRRQYLIVLRLTVLLLAGRSRIALANVYDVDRVDDDATQKACTVGN